MRSMKVDAELEQMVIEAAKVAGETFSEFVGGAIDDYCKEVIRKRTEMDEDSIHAKKRSEGISSKKPRKNSH